MKRSTTLLSLGTAALLAACSGGEKAQAGTAANDAPPTPAASAAGGELTPDPGGRIITVEMLTDDEGNNVFRPAEFEAKPGDVVRYTLVSGVHNTHFVADSNPGVSGLPAASEMLQAPGQTHDVKVPQAPGKHYFQCDPHALLGMKGHMTVLAP